MPRRPRPPKSEEARRAQLRLLSAAAGFFVIAVIGGVIAMGWDVVTSPGFRNMVESVRNGGKKNPSEKDWRDKIAYDKSHNDNNQLVADEYNFGDWLYSNSRYVEARDMYRDCVTHARKMKDKRDEWLAGALARVGFAMHKIYLDDGPLPDPAPVEEAIPVEPYPKSKVHWKYMLARIYADRGDFAKAENIANEAKPTPLMPSDAVEWKMVMAEIALRKGDLAKAKELIATIGAETESDDWRDVRDAAKQMEPGAKERRAQGGVVQAYWRSRQYDKLDKIAADLRKSEKAQVDGDWDLNDFYSDLTVARKRGEGAWKEAFSQCDEWAAKFPQSPTPHVLAAKIWKDYAWKARGSGWANSVTDEGWAKFGDRLDKAHAELDAAARCPVKCPEAQSVAQTVALGQGMEKTQYQHLVDTGIAQFPHYTPIYTGQAWYLQPRWNGDEGEWDKVISAECDKVGGTAGDITYARVVWSLMPYYDNVFAEAGADWARTQRGFETLQKQFPKSGLVAVTEAQLEAQYKTRGLKRSDGEQG